MPTEQKILIIKDYDQLFNKRFENMVVIFEYNIRVFVVNCIFSECDIFYINDKGQLVEGMPTTTVDINQMPKDL